MRDVSEEERRGEERGGEARDAVSGAVSNVGRRVVEPRAASSSKRKRDAQLRKIFHTCTCTHTAINIEHLTHVQGVGNDVLVFV